MFYILYLYYIFLYILIIIKNNSLRFCEVKIFILLPIVRTKAGEFVSQRFVWRTKVEF